MKNEKPSMCDELNEKNESQYNDELVITFKFAVTGDISEEKFPVECLSDLFTQFYFDLNSCLFRYTNEKIFPISCGVESYGLKGE